MSLCFSNFKRDSENNKNPFTDFLLLGEGKKEWLIKIRRDEGLQFKAENGVDCGRGSFLFHLLTCLSGQCTIQPRFLSRDPR